VTVGDDLAIKDIAERTGIAAGTIRMWEQRYGFPEPQRLPSGHRRYRDSDVEVVLEVLRLRESGLPVKTAIERALSGREGRPRSIFAEIRRLRPELPVSVLPKRSVIALSHAIEDESACVPEELLLFGAFQREKHFRSTEKRWRELSVAADTTFVFADFPEVRHPAGGPIEIPVEVDEPLVREWSIVCEGRDRGVCLAGWEPPGQAGVPEPERLFETIWTTDRQTVRVATEVCCRLAADAAPDEVERLADRLAEPVAPAGDALRHAEAVANRMIGYLARI
jgi:DNA-binding transcriptional MerR regulator